MRPLGYYKRAPSSLKKLSLEEALLITTSLEKRNFQDKSISFATAWWSTFLLVFFDQEKRCLKERDYREKAFIRYGLKVPYLVDSLLAEKEREREREREKEREDIKEKSTIRSKDPNKRELWNQTHIIFILHWPLRSASVFTPFARIVPSDGRARQRRRANRRTSHRRSFRRPSRRADEAARFSSRVPADAQRRWSDRGRSGTAVDQTPRKHRRRRKTEKEPV